jgi:hypothetical protein
LAGVGCGHFTKAVERRTQLLTILSEEQHLTPAEREIAGELIGKLNKAISTAGGA